jgi:hypothetical protein
VVAHAGQPLQRVEGLEVASQGGVHPGAVEDGLLAVEVHELLQREGVSDHVGGGVLEALPVVGIDRLAHVCREAGMSPGEKPLDELGRGGVPIEKPGEDSFAEEGHEECGVPARQGEEAAVRREAAGSDEQVKMGVPLQEVSRRGKRDDEAGAEVLSGRAADELDGGLGPRPGELGQEVTPTAKQWPQQTRDGEHHVAVGDGSEELLAQPFGPEELLLLLAGGAEAAATAGKGDEYATAALGAPQPREAVLEEAALEELAQDPFHHRPQGPMLPDEAGGPDSQQLLEVLLDQPEEWRLPRSPRLVDRQVISTPSSKPRGEPPAAKEGGPRGQAS